MKNLFSRGYTNLRNQLSTDFQRVKLAEKTFKKLPENLQYALPIIWAKVHWLDTSTVIMKVSYLERKGENIVNVYKMFNLNIEDITILEIEEA